MSSHRTSEWYCKQELLLAARLLAVISVNHCHILVSEISAHHQVLLEIVLVNSFIIIIKMCKPSFHLRMEWQCFLASIIIMYVLKALHENFY